MEWFRHHLKAGDQVYLIDMVPDLSMPSGLRRRDLKCELVSLSFGTPIWLRLKALEPPDKPGLAIDTLQKDQILTSFRDIDSLAKQIYITEPIDHLDPPCLRLAELVFEEMWIGRYYRSCACPEKDACTNENIKHLVKYRHS